MVSHRPRKRTWTNQTKGDQRRKNLGEKGPKNAVQHSPCAKSAARGGAQRSLHHHRRLQRSEVDGPARIAARQVLHRLLLQKSTSPCEDSDMEKKSRKDIAVEKSKLQKERERERERERENTNMIKPSRTKIEIATLKRPSRRPSGGHTGRSKKIHRRTPSPLYVTQNRKKQKQRHRSSSRESRDNNIGHLCAMMRQQGVHKQTNKKKEKQEAGATEQ